MTGENRRWRALGSVQPGGRRPAPGQLSLVQAFINTHYDLQVTHGADLLANPDALGEWLLAAGLLDRPALLGDGELERAIAVREGLRALAGANGTGGRLGPEDLTRLNGAAAGASAEVRFRASGPSLAPATGDAFVAALGLLLGLTAWAMIDGSWSRLKICPGVECGWAFYDHSRNHTGRWCSMSVCGARAKARAYYARGAGAR